MAAVIGLPLEEVREILREHCPELDLANINSLQQIVVSGPLESIAAASSVFEDAFAAYVPLRVSGAFHSRYMAQAEALLAQTLHSVTFKTPAFPVISNVNALPYSANDLPHLLVKQLTSPVRWLDSIQYVLGAGMCECHELGPGQVLQNLLEKILSGR
jgi:trans-AT polyketide synthase/acyltransferase/oxidoreductase domain-containing protein